MSLAMKPAAILTISLELSLWSMVKLLWSLEPRLYSLCCGHLGKGFRDLANTVKDCLWIIFIHHLQKEIPQSYFLLYIKLYNWPRNSPCTFLVCSLKNTVIIPFCKWRRGNSEILLLFCLKGREIKTETHRQRVLLSADSNTSPNTMCRDEHRSLGTQSVLPRECQGPRDSSLPRYALAKSRNWKWSWDSVPVTPIWNASSSIWLSTPKIHLKNEF